jgi:hypothetical protein
MVKYFAISFFLLGCNKESDIRDIKEFAIEETLKTYEDKWYKLNHPLIPEEQPPSTRLWYQLSSYFDIFKTSPKLSRHFSSRAKVLNIPGLFYRYELTYQVKSDTQPSILAIEAYECSDTKNTKQLHACLSTFDEGFSEEGLELDGLAAIATSLSKLNDRKYLIGIKIVIATRNHNGQTSISNQYMYHTRMINHDEA